MGQQASKLRSREDLEQILSKLKRGPEKVGKTKNAILFKSRVIDAFNLCDMRTIRAFCSDDGIFCFKGADRGMPLTSFLDSVELIHASFPDICLSFDKVEEVEDGIVKVFNARSRGTHTGAPFAFGQFPAIPQTGISVEDENGEYTITISKGKVTKFMMDMPEGDLIGPAGYYLKIGGKMYTKSKEPK